MQHAVLTKLILTLDTNNAACQDVLFSYLLCISVGAVVIHMIISIPTLLDREGETLRLS